MPDLALLNEVLYGTSHVFYRYFGVHAVLIVKIDGINAESFDERRDPVSSDSVPWQRKDEA